MRTKPGWHGYWVNPGDAGLPMKIEWQLPPGARLGPLRFPVPDKLLVAGIVNYVYERDHALLTRLKVPADAKGVVPIRAEAQWLACTDKVCVPERGEFLARPAGWDGRGDRARPVRRMAPRAAAAAGQPGEVRNEGRHASKSPFRFRESVAIGEPYFFPADDGPIDYAAPQSFPAQGRPADRRAEAPSRRAGRLVGRAGAWRRARAGDQCRARRSARGRAAASAISARRRCFTPCSARWSAASCST